MSFYELIKRNLKIYFRDGFAIFFSVLAIIIGIVIMLCFLSDFQVDAIMDSLSAFPGRGTAEDEKNVKILVLQWVAAGIIGVNAVTVTIGFYSCMISDRTSGKLNSIYTSPTSRFIISSSYIFSAWICSIIMCTITLFLSELYCIIQGAEPYSLTLHLKLLGIIAVNSFTYSAFMYLLSMLSKTQGAWGGIGTVMGTVIGFLGGIYLPISNLSNGIATAIKFLPFIYSTKLFREIMTKDMQGVVFEATPAQIIKEYRLDMGVDLEFFSHKMENIECVAVLLGFGIVMLALGGIATKYAKKS